VEEQTLGIPRESMCAGPGELPVDNDRDIFFLKKNPQHVQVLKSRSKAIELFHLWNYFFNEVVAIQTINFRHCASGGLGLSDNIDQAQSRTKL
jgi:hypothetical protein